VASLADASFREKDEIALTREQPAVEIIVVSAVEQASDYYSWPTQPHAQATQLDPDYYYG
jgi:hypothetical protein